MLGMPITVNIVDSQATQENIDEVFAYFKYIDNKFSVFKKDSEINQINRGEIMENEYSDDMEEIFLLAEKTKKESHGYFDIHHKGKLNPSGVVKGWAIHQAAKILEKDGFSNFYVDAGGDIQVKGNNHLGKPWTLGIRNPFNRNENIKIVKLINKGIATSGTYIRGQHIYNPFKPQDPIMEIVSLTVIGPNVFEADRFATPAFAMGKEGILFIESIQGLEGYMIDSNGVATFTKGWNQYVYKD